MTYDERYFADRRAGERNRAAMRAQELERLRRRSGLEGGTVVDVGCGLGELLDLFPRDRWRKYGIEVSESARETCAAKGISFELPAEREWCDLVLLRGSLRHLDRPIQALFDAYGWLRRGGLARRARDLERQRGIRVRFSLLRLLVVNRLFQELPALDPLRNFVVFSDRVLRQCLVNVGFQESSFEYPYRGSGGT